MQLLKHIIPTILVILLLQITSNAQYVGGKSVNVNVAGGLFTPHKQAVQHLQDGPSYGIEVVYSKRVNGHGFHHSAYKMPYYGLMTGFFNSGNLDLVGYEAYLDAFGSLPFYKHKNPLMIKGAIGLGYVQKIYNKYTNPLQSAIGSRFNLNAQLRLEKTFELEPQKGGITLGFGISHYSNSGYQYPNFGTNYLHFYLGKRFILEQESIYPDTTNVIAILPYSPKKIEIEGNFGFKGYPKKLTQKFLLLNLSAHYIRQFSVKQSWSNGLDLYYNGELRQNENKPIQVGISSLYVKNFGRFKVGGGFGIYLYGAPSRYRFIYNKAFFQYYVDQKHWYIKFNIKTHLTTADFFTLGVGYAL